MFPRSTCLNCKCNNVVIDGAQPSKAYHTGLSLAEQHGILKRETPIFHVPMYAVTVFDFGSVRFSQVNDHHIVMSCSSCKKTYHLYQSNGNLFIQNSKYVDIKIDEMNETAQQIENTIPATFIPFFKRLSSDDECDFVENDDENVYDQPSSYHTIRGTEDDDYDYMFSGTIVPIVGSYVESMVQIVPEIYA